jgi:ABC-type branched-subunit amino acid transport system substrate-binding protein
MRRSKWLGVLAVSLGLVAVACGSDNKGTAGGGGTQSTAAAGTTPSTTTAGTTPSTTAASTTPSTAANQAAKPTGAPIKFGLMLPINAPVSQPYIETAAKIAAAAVNDAGGVLGRPVEIDVCDDQYTPQNAAVCAQKLLVDDKVLMMVGNPGQQEPSLTPVLDQANTVSWASFGASVDSLKSPRVYILAPNQVSYWAVPQLLPPGTKHVAFLRPVGVAVADTAFNGAKAYFPPEVQVDSVGVPLDATDMQPYCLQLQSSGATVAVPQQNPGQVAKEIQVCNQIGLTNITWVIPSLQLTPDVIKTVSDLKQPNVVGLSYGGDRLQQWTAELAKYGPSVGVPADTVSDPTIGAWLGVHLAAEFLPKVGSLDGASIKAYLDKQNNFVTGATAPIDFTATPVAALPRLKNFSVTKGGIKDGKLQVLDPAPVVVKPLGS